MGLFIDLFKLGSSLVTSSFKKRNDIFTQLSKMKQTQRPLLLNENVIIEKENNIVETNTSTTTPINTQTITNTIESISTTTPPITQTSTNTTTPPTTIKRKPTQRIIKEKQITNKFDDFKSISGLGAVTIKNLKLNKIDTPKQLADLTDLQIKNMDPKIRNINSFRSLAIQLVNNNTNSNKISEEK